MRFTSASRLIFRTNVSTRCGAQKRFEIRSAQGTDPRSIAKLYNHTLAKIIETPGMAITDHDIQARLHHDPESVHLGFINGELSSLINIVKLDLASENEIPKTHQKLTVNESYASTDPDNGNMWFCPWITVYKPFQGLKVKIDGIPRSLGQLHVLTVKEEALAHGKVKRLFAYSRPVGLKRKLEADLGSDIGFIPNPAEEKASIWLINQANEQDEDQARFLIANPGGLCLSGELVLSMQEYWDQKDQRGRRIDPVFNFHARNGAGFVPDLVMPYGQIYDVRSLGYRTLLEYPI